MNSLDRYKWSNSKWRLKAFCNLLLPILKCCDKYCFVLPLPLPSRRISSYLLSQWRWMNIPQRKFKLLLKSNWKIKLRVNSFKSLLAFPLFPMTIGQLSICLSHLWCNQLSLRALFTWVNVKLSKGNGKHVKTSGFGKEWINNINSNNNNKIWTDQMVSFCQNEEEFPLFFRIET